MVAVSCCLFVCGLLVRVVCWLCFAVVVCCLLLFVVAVCVCLFAVVFSLLLFVVVCCGLLPLLCAVRCWCVIRVAC